MILETQRLNIINPIFQHTEEAVEFYKHNKKHFQKWEPDRKDDYYTFNYWKKIIAYMKKFQEQGHGYLFYLRKRDSSQIIGSIVGSNLELSHFNNIKLGFNLDHSHEGQGYMFEALNAVFNYNFYILGLQRIEVAYNPINARSQKILDRLGFKKIGHDPDYIILNNLRVGHNLAALHRKNWHFF